MRASERYQAWFGSEPLALPLPDRAAPPATQVIRQVTRVALVAVGLFLFHHLYDAFFVNAGTYGTQDWDIGSVFRFSPLIHLVRYREGPWWNPWTCGGVPDWGYVESATNLISPYLPAYLTYPLPMAERIELIGSDLVALVSVWLLAGRATSLASVRFFCAAVYALNGRWVMQATVGHTWHLQYAWTPLVLYFFLRAVEELRWRFAVAGGAVLALTVYQGGVYPLPHTALLLGALAVVCALATNTVLPLRLAAATSVVAAGLSAPKLLPVLLTMHKLPREIDSTESMSLSDLLATLVSPGQTISKGPIELHPYRWHEYGAYVGWPAVLALVAFLFLARGRIENGLRAVAVLLFVLSLGAFAAWAPWTLLHDLPVFSSQHVPSRFVEPALLVAALGLCFAVERWSAPLGERRVWLDLALVIPVLWITSDLVTNQKPSADRTFKLVAPDITPAATFRQERKSNQTYTTLRNQGSMLLATYANTGVVECYGYPTTPQEGVGAIPSDSRAYQGEAFVLDGEGHVVPELPQLTAWTPNSATVRLPQPHPGDTLVYNMNSDPGWSANGRASDDSGGRVAAKLEAGETEVRFTYWPPGLSLGCFLALATVAGTVIARRRGFLA